MKTKAEAIAQLREWIKPGDTVYTVLRYVSRSGMQRTIGVVIMREDGGMLHPNYAVSLACGYTEDRKRDGVKVSGGGMDIGFHLVDTLNYVLYPTGAQYVDRSGNGLTVTEATKRFRHEWI